MAIASFTERVERLERQVRFWRLSVIFFVGLSLTVLATHLRATTDRINARIISAQQFDILNADGRVVGRMSEDPGNPSGFAGALVFMYPNQKAALRVGVEGKYGPGLDLFDTNGRTRATVNFGSDGPAVDLFDETHRPIIAMEISSKGPRFKILDKSLTKYLWTAP